MAWLVSNSSLTLEAIEEVSGKDPYSRRQLYIFALVTSRICKIPQCLGSQPLCSMTLHARHVLCGRRLSRLRRDALVNEQNGCIDWKHVGFYEAVWEADEERLKTVKHKPTGHLGTIPNHVFVNRDFSLWFNWDDPNSHRPPKITKNNRK